MDSTSKLVFLAPHFPFMLKAKQSSKLVNTYILSIFIWLYAEYTTLWHNHFDAARFVVTLFGVAHFVAGPFLSGPFWREFYENNLIFSFCFNFSIYKKIFLFSFFVFFFFKNSRKTFCLFLINFFPLYIKKIHIQTHRYCFFIRLFQ